MNNREATRWIAYSQIFLAIGVISLCMVFMSGCNTMAGLGRDIQSAAQGIQDRMSQPDDPYSTASRR